MAILSALGTEVFIPVAAAVGVAFAVAQWLLVARVKVNPAHAAAAAASGGSKNGGYGDYLIEEEEGLNAHNVVVKCHEIQTAISEGESLSPSQIWPRRLVRLDLIVPVAVSAETMRLSRVLRGDYLYY